MTSSLLLSRPRKHKTMNVLSQEQMVEIEEQLLAQNVEPAYRMSIPNAVESKAAPAGLLFSEPQPTTKKMLGEAIPLAYNTRALPLSDPNSVPRVLALVMLTGILQEHPTSSLLEHVKTTLYSPTMLLASVKASPPQMGSTQVKAAVAGVFKTLASRKSIPNSIGLAQMLMQRNHVLTECWVLMFRVILGSFEVENADNYKQALSFEAAVSGVFDYLDITYHGQGGLFLLPDYNMFLLQSGKQVALGSYFTSQEEMPHQELKSTVERNMIESMLVKEKRKNSVEQQDVQMFNFLLNSGNHEELRNTNKDSETPHFGSNSDFHFNGPVKKSQEIKKSQEMKQVHKEFAELILDQSSQEDIDLTNGPGLASSPNSNYSLGDGSFPKKRVQTEMPQRESLDYHPSSPPDYNSETNLVKYHQADPFSRAQSDAHGSHGAPLTQLQQMMNCYCRPIKHQRMTIESNTVTFSVKPTIPRTYENNSHLYATRTLRNTQSRTPNKDEGPKRDNNKTPTFLKNLIRDKSVKNIKSSELLPPEAQKTPERKDSGWECKSHSGPFHGAKNPTSSLKRTHTINVDQPQQRNPEGQVGNTTTNTSRLVQAQWKNRSQIYIPKQHQPAPQVQQQPQQYQGSGQQRAPVKFYAPVHIIAPTYYVNQGTSSNTSGIYKPSQHPKKGSPIHNQRQHGQPSHVRTSPNIAPSK